MNKEKMTEEGRKISGFCAEILLTWTENLLTCAEIVLTCTYLYLSKMKEGIIMREELERRKQGFWFLHQNLTYLYLLELKDEGRNG